MAADEKRKAREALLVGLSKMVDAAHAASMQDALSAEDRNLVGIYLGQIKEASNGR